MASGLLSTVSPSGPRRRPAFHRPADPTPSDSRGSPSTAAPAGAEQADGTGIGIRASSVQDARRRRGFGGIRAGLPHTLSDIPGRPLQRKPPFRLEICSEFGAAAADHAGAGRGGRMQAAEIGVAVEIALQPFRHSGYGAVSVVTALLATQRGRCDVTGAKEDYGATEDYQNNRGWRGPTRVARWSEHCRDDSGCRCQCDQRRGLIRADQSSSTRAEWSGAVSNRRHRPFQGRALPTELPDHHGHPIDTKNTGFLGQFDDRRS